MASLVLLGVLAAGLPPLLAAGQDDVDAALSLAEFLRSARTVISGNQARINDPGLGDKGLTGDAVVAAAIQNMITTTGVDPREVDPKSEKGRLLAAMALAVKEVMDANQPVINEKGEGFKGFVPAVFARLATEQFRRDQSGRAEIKVTAPPELVRNRKASPDAFETDVIRTKFQSPGWTRDAVYAATTTVDGRPATRVLVPEYYGADCLVCHGMPKGEIDITGYPKEGASLGDLGGVVSVTLFD
ncbi:MAG: Tll0287-like domain-containing protein [Inquilinus sp.]|uniref:Tll0287-like domain-containing protein n=1 Tax=Inquilinus sp. TaxID=1932117 RepID=UPI003F367760